MNRRDVLKALLATGGVATVGGLGVVNYNKVDYSQRSYQAWYHDDPLGYSAAEYLVLAGTLAASPHNTQPWKFAVSGSSIDLYADHSRHLGKADPVRRMMGQGLGCAIENMAVMATAMGFDLSVDDSICNENFYNNGLVARMKFQRLSDMGQSNAHTGQLKDLPEVKAIFNRQTNRSSYTGIGKVSSHYFDTVVSQSPIADVGVTWIDDREQCQAVGQLCSATVREFLSGDATHDAMKWFRRNRAELLSTGDGISIFQNNAPLLIKHWMELAATEEDLVNQQSKQSEVDMVDASCGQVPLWGVIHSNADLPNNWLSAGRALEKCYLLSAQLGYAICPISYPVESTVGREALRQIAGLDTERVPQALVRVGLASRMERSVRRSLQSVLV